MLVPPEIILDSLLEERADIPINAIHMFSGFKADLYPVRTGDEVSVSMPNTHVTLPRSYERNEISSIIDTLRIG